MYPEGEKCPNTLQKNLNVWRSIGLVVGSVLGSGLLILPGLTYNQVGIHSFYSWLGMGFLIIPFLFIFSKIMIKYPSAGGLVNVIHLVMGNKFGFAMTSAIILSISILVPIVSIVGANYICYIMNLPANSNILIAWSLLLIFTVINTFNAKISLKIQGATSIILLLLLFLIVFTSLIDVTEKFIQSAVTNYIRDANIKQIWTGMTLVFWAFLGWENLSFATEEFENIKKDLNIVIIISYLIMMFLYLGLSASVIVLLDAENPKTISAPLAEIVRVSLGTHTGIVVASIAFLIMLININAWVLGPSRMVFDAGRKNIIPNIFSKLNHHHTPYYALYGLLFLYTINLILFFLLGQDFINISIKQVNCVFLLLYLLTVLAYIKISKTLFDKVIGIFTAGLITIFLLKFGIYLILPTILFTIPVIKLLIEKLKYLSNFHT